MPCVFLCFSQGDSQLHNPSENHFVRIARLPARFLERPDEVVCRTRRWCLDAFGICPPLPNIRTSEALSVEHSARLTFVRCTSTNQAFNNPRSTLALSCSSFSIAFILCRRTARLFIVGMITTYFPVTAIRSPSAACRVSSSLIIRFILSCVFR